MVIRNHNSEVINFHINVEFLHHLRLKLLRLEKVSFWKKRLQLDQIMIESDNLTMVNAINGIWKCPWDIEIIISDILLLLTDFRTVQVSHIFREANAATDLLVKLCHTTSLRNLRTHQELQALIRKDAIG
ncbi:LOW QUALITY PROTEIN: hypothetical protein V2J09_018130 [Rumex salicifolius]